MKKMIIAMGLVALGMGQIQAQEAEDTPWSLRLPDNDRETWSMRLLEPLATMITTAKIRVIGKQRLYQCEDGVVPPNCRYNDPPADINQCGSWSSTFRVIWGVQCPPTFPTRFIYWMDRCAGGYSEVARWTLHPSGTCANGYYDANSLLEGTNPDCLRRAPIPQCTPPPCHGCGFAAFDGSNRRFLTMVEDFHQFQEQSCAPEFGTTCQPGVDAHLVRRSSYDSLCHFTYSQVPADGLFDFVSCNGNIVESGIGLTCEASVVSATVKYCFEDHTSPFGPPCEPPSPRFYVEHTFTLSNECTP